jgi:hypothetical protein
MDDLWFCAMLFCVFAVAVNHFRLILLDIACSGCVVMFLTGDLMVE